MWAPTSQVTLVRATSRVSITLMGRAVRSQFLVWQRYYEVSKSSCFAFRDLHLYETSLRSW